MTWSRVALTCLVLAAVPPIDAARGEDCPVFLIRRDAKEALTVERETVAAGQMQVWTAGPDSGMMS